MFRYICIIFRESCPSTLLNLPKPLKVTNSIKQYIKMFTYVNVTVDDKIQSIKRCGLSGVVITVRGNC